ncbi:MAG TPA: RHS repeat-associated core domain-containing protein [Gemmatimonadales bacterium]|nr:RHS repeat-associated core domain-containing protein [Gemmatimonadales bacterium]
MQHRDGALSYGYLGTGNLGSVTAPAETLDFSYDGSLLTGVMWSGTVAGDVTAVYDNDFRVTELAVNGSTLATLGYDGDGLLTQAGDLAIQRDALNGRIDSTYLGTVTTGEAYDAFGQWAARTARAGSTELYRAEYTRDALGRITGLLEVVEGDTTLFAYTYDDAGRLIEVRTNGVVTASYVYDDNGNRFSVTRPSGMVTGTYDAQDRLLSYAGATYGYTRAGELRFKAEGGDTTFYRYDALGNLLEVNLPDGTDIEYIVDGFNRRVGKKVNGVLVQGFLYQDQLNPVAELDGTGTVVSRFVYGTRANVPDYMIKGGVTYRIVADHLGSVRLVVRATDGVVVQRIAYDEFGRELMNTNPGLQPFGYAGGLTDGQTGLIRFGARDYDPVSGRWTTKDPVRFAGQDTHLYSYVRDDPVNTVDITGLQPRSLSSCVKEFISKFQTDVFPDVDLDRIRIHVGEAFPWYVRMFATIEPSAFTFNYDIYFAEGAFQPGSASGVADLLHEIYHVQQYQSNGPAIFAGMYLAEAARQWLWGRDPYWNNRFEIDAFQLERLFDRYIGGAYGQKGPCPGECP